MRELNVNEIKNVHGGIFPFLAAAYSLAGSFAVRSLGGYFLQRGFAMYSMYEAARYYDRRR